VARRKARIAGIRYCVACFLFIYKNLRSDPLVCLLGIPSILQAASLQDSYRKIVPNREVTTKNPPLGSLRPAPQATGFLIHFYT